MVEVIYYPESLKIKDCYKLDREARWELLTRIYSDVGEKIDRTIMNAEGELAAHCYLYRMGIKKASTVDADLEYKMRRQMVCEACFRPSSDIGRLSGERDDVIDGFLEILIAHV